MEKELFKLFEKVYMDGVAEGAKQANNRIKEHCKSGKPVLIDGELYFCKDSRQHLIEIMDQIDRECGI